MQNLLLSLSLVASAAIGALAETTTDSGLKIDITLPVECERKAEKGDNVEVHYKGMLENGNKFDASYDRGSPFGVQLGAGRVIKGWEEGLLGMCIGEKRTLTIPPSLGYGQRAMGPIPAGSTLIFETELMGIKGVDKPESIVTKASATSEATEEASPGIGGKIAGKVGEAVAEAAGEAAGVVGDIIVDGDDGQEHNEL